jgi:hypothetical protein
MNKKLTKLLEDIEKNPDTNRLMELLKVADSSLTDLHNRYVKFIENTKK